LPQDQDSLSSALRQEIAQDTDFPPLTQLPGVPSSLPRSGTQHLPSTIHPRIQAPNRHRDSQNDNALVPLPPSQSAAAAESSTADTTATTRPRRQVYLIPSSLNILWEFDTPLELETEVEGATVATLQDLQPFVLGQINGTPNAMTSLLSISGRTVNEAADAFLEELQIAYRKKDFSDILTPLRQFEVCVCLTINVS
jgi:hypothetical protein